MSISQKRHRFGDAIALAARLKHRVTIQQRSRSDDGAGGSSVSWSNVAIVWAELRSRESGADEKAAGGQLQAQARLQMTMRYRSGITSDMRVLYRGQSYNIRRVENVDHANVLLELLLEEGVAL